jgi:hypothetical protein
MKERRSGASYRRGLELETAGIERGWGEINGEVTSEE